MFCYKCFDLVMVIISCSESNFVVVKVIIVRKGM